MLSLDSRAAFRWNGGPASECWTWVAVLCTSANSTGYVSLIWVATSQPAPAITTIARPKAHQVEARSDMPWWRIQAASGCSSAHSSIAAMNGSTTSRRCSASRKAR